MTDRPTIPPEAVEAGLDAAEVVACEAHQFPGPVPGMVCITATSDAGFCRKCWRLRLLAALPHLRRAILAEVVPQVVEMARAPYWTSNMVGPYNDILYTHTPASILAALEKGDR